LIVDGHCALRQILNTYSENEKTDTRIVINETGCSGELTGNDECA
jgi:hypothetical protein